MQLRSSYKCAETSERERERQTDRQIDRDRKEKKRKGVERKNQSIHMTDHFHNASTRPTTATPIMALRGHS